MRLIIVFFLTFISATAIADLAYFDRKMIAENGIKELTEIIVENITDNGSCTAYRYRFDPSGNIISEGLLRTGTFYRYHYDAGGKMNDWSWLDKSNGEQTFFSKVYENEPKNFVYELAKKNENHKKLLEKRASLKGITTRKIWDGCANIDAFYSIRLKSEKDGLPKVFEATLVKDGEQFQSPLKLFIIYKYSYFQ